MAITKVLRAKSKSGYAYRVRVDAGFDHATGKRRQIGETVATRKEAEALEARLKREVETGTALIPDQATLAELLEEWLAVKESEVSSNTIVDYRNIVENRLIPALGSRKVQKITTRMIQAQLAKWKSEGMSDRAITDAVKRLRQALKYAQEQGVVYLNVGDNVSLPRAEKGEIRRKATSAWNADEAATFLFHAEHMPIMTRAGDTGRREPDPLWPLWPLLVLEGVRRGEALGLAWRNVNVDRGTITIVETVIADKGNNGAAKFTTPKTESSGRTIQLTARTLEALKRHKAAQGKRRLQSESYRRDLDLVVCTRDGNPIAPANCQRSFERIIARAGLRKIRLHDLRHTSATLLLMSGQPMKVVSERLGHTRVQITLDLYGHVLDGMDAKAADAMDLVLDTATIIEREETGKIVSITG